MLDSSVEEHGTIMSLLNHQDDAKWDEKLINFRKHWTVSCRSKHANTFKPHRQWGSRKPLFILPLPILILLELKFQKNWEFWGDFSPFSWQPLRNTQLLRVQSHSAQTTKNLCTIPKLTLK